MPAFPDALTHTEVDRPAPTSARDLHTAVSTPIRPATGAPARSRAPRLLLAALLCVLVGPLLAVNHAQPGRDGDGGALTGIVNTYHPGTASAAVGSTSIAVGAAAGAATPIVAGDLLLVIQMQGADIDVTNTSGYGDGAAGDPASGYLAGTLQAGRHEYVEALGPAAGTVAIRGLGPGGGLVNSYAAAAAGTQGQRTFQVIRVPQYLTATLTSGLTAPAWDGSTGGVLALDIRETLTLGGNVDLTARGFRGAGSQRRGTAQPAPLVLEYVTPSGVDRNAGKGEGIAGTPRFSYSNITGVVSDNGAEGWAAGSSGAGAPGNAGGGATDWTGTNHNSGGGGGGNASAGGRGGLTWNSSATDGTNIGGFGGGGVPIDAATVTLGGGGGAGSRNDTAGPDSSGGSGGGMVLVRTGSVAGAGVITVDGGAGRGAGNEGAGGGGAAGTVVFIADEGSLAGLTIRARGGIGGNAWPTQSGTVNAHGPGGGGAGGAVLTNVGGASVDVDGGAPGTTLTAQLPYGATVGSDGLFIPVDAADIPGLEGGATLELAELGTSTKRVVDTNGGDAEPGDTLRYSITLTDTAGVTASGVQVLDDIAGNLGSFAIVAIPAGASDQSDPAGGSSGNGLLDVRDITVPANGSVEIVFDVQVDGLAQAGDPVDNSASISAPRIDLTVVAPTLTVSASSVPERGNKPLYLDIDGASNAPVALRRTLPVVGNANDTWVEVDGRGGVAEWPLAPGLVANLTLEAGTISVPLFVRAQGNRTGAARDIRVDLVRASAPTVPIATDTISAGIAASAGDPALLVFELPLAAPVTITPAEGLLLRVTNDTRQANGRRRVRVHARSGAFAADDLDGRSKVILPAATVINVDALTVFDAAFPDGTGGGVYSPGDIVFLRAVVSDPFGSFDISGATLGVLDADGVPVLSPTVMSEVDDDGILKTFETAFAIPANAATGFWTAEVIAEEGIEGDVTHARTGSFEVARPEFLVMKTSTVISDPVNGSDNPKRIPGAVIAWQIRVTNQGRGRADPGAVVLSDALPGSVVLAADSGNGALVGFVDGASGLTLDAALDVRLTNQPGGGGPHDAAAVDADGDGFLDDVTGLRITPSGRMNGNVVGPVAPFFSVTYRTRID